ncbi:MAG TPA: cupin domain-containing protein [Bryobacteraceae bacterium]|nr:cupin domain-containing protein [Bryobacteraceae bacterium]
MTIYNWEDVKLEQMNPLLGRQAIHCANMTVAMIHLDSGCIVPEHRHANEQVSVLLQGRLRFLSEGKEYTIAAGQVLHIPPNAPHSVEALEDSLAMDLFSPAREDWRSGDDAYLRGPK